jgi:hypothetical protein
MERLRVINDLVMARALKEFATGLGMSDKYADILAQVHVKSSEILKHWPIFLERNCLRCKNDPEKCAFFHPTAEVCAAGATPESTRRANVVVVEMGSLKDCPCFNPG